MPKTTRIQEYRLHQLLNNYVNACHMAAKIPFTLGFVMMCMITGYFGSIRYFEKLPLQQYIMFPAMLNNSSIVAVLLLLPSAIQHKRSNLVLKMIKNKPPTVINKITRREMKSLREFGIRLGFLKRIKFGHIAAFLFAITNYTLSLLVAFPDH